MGLKMLVNTVMKLNLVICDGNSLGLLPHRARSALLIEHRLALGAIHFTIGVRVPPEPVLCPGRCSARMLMANQFCCINLLIHIRTALPLTNLSRDNSRVIYAFLLQIALMSIYSAQE